MKRRDALAWIGALIAGAVVIDPRGRQSGGRARIDVRDAGSLASAVEAAGGAETTIVLDRGPAPVTSDLTIPPNVELRIPQGGTVRPGPGVTVTIGGPVDAGSYRTFDIGAGGVVHVTHPTTVLVPQWWGARGDGRADDYDALLAALESLNRRGGGTLDLPTGTYRIGRYRIMGGPRANGVAPLELRDCSDVTLRGNGSRLDFRGDFHRSDDTGRGVSHANSVHVALRNCSGARVEGLELDGNVDEMTRDEEVIEHASNTGLRILGGSDVEVRDVHLHHWATDGFYLSFDARQRGTANVLRAVRFTRVRSVYNGRAAGGVTNVLGGTFTDCVFSHTGRANGTYGGHAPRLGIGIEPIGVGRGRVDRKTGDLEFVRCRLEDCVGPVLSAPYWNRYEGTIAFRDCDFDVGPGSSRNKLAFVLQAPDGIVERCRIDGRGRGIYLTWRSTNESRTLFRETELRTAAAPGVIARAAAPLRIERCRVVGTHTEPQRHPVVVVTDPLARIHETEIRIPAAAHDGEGAYTAVRLAIQEACGNRYETDPAVLEDGVLETNYAGTRQVGDERYATRAWRPRRVPAGRDPARTPGCGA